MLVLRGRTAGGHAALPARGPRVRSLGLALPPERMPLWRRGSALKRWRYVGIYTREVILCVGHARIGPIPRRWWAIAEPDGTLHGDSSTGRGGVTLDGSSVRVDAPGAHIDLELQQAEAVETASPVGRRGNYIWTGKPAGGMEPRDRRPRRAGGQRAHPLGRRPTREVGAVTFAADLSEVSFAEGGRLHFTEWSSREESTDMLLVRSAYRQPFGTFSGHLPGGVRLAEGYGVMEDHDVWW